MIIEALTKANVRGILTSGWGGLKAMDLPEHILKIEEAPFTWLFPQMAAIVHHGGAGTTATGLRAGRPVESPDGTTPPGSHTTVRESLDSYGSC